MRLYMVSSNITCGVLKEFYIIRNNNIIVDIENNIEIARLVRRLKTSSIVRFHEIRKQLSSLRLPTPCHRCGCEGR